MLCYFNLFYTYLAEVCALWEVLPDQTIRILTGSSFPRAVGVAEVYLHLRIGCKEFMLSHFLSVIIGHTPLHLLRQGGEFFFKSFPYTVSIFGRKRCQDYCTGFTFY